MKKVIKQIETMNAATLNSVRKEIYPRLRVGRKQFDFWYELLQVIDKEIDERRKRNEEDFNRKREEYRN